MLHRFCHRAYLLSCPSDLPPRSPLYSRVFSPQPFDLLLQVALLLLSLWNSFSPFSWGTPTFSRIPVQFSRFTPSSFQSVNSISFSWQNEWKAEILSPSVSESHFASCLSEFSGESSSRLNWFFLEGIAPSPPASDVEKPDARLFFSSLESLWGHPFRSTVHGPCLPVGHFPLLCCSLPQVKYFYFGCCVGSKLPRAYS